MQRGDLERLHSTLTQGWVLFWRNALAITFYLNWLWFLFQNRILTQPGIVTLGSPLWRTPSLLSFQLCTATHSPGWSFSDSCSLVSTLKLCLTLPSPGPSQAVMLPSPAWSLPRRRENPLGSAQVFFIFCPFPHLGSFILLCQFLVCCP